MEKRIGAFAGKFLPPHMGHVSEIASCANQVDELWVVVADKTTNSKKLCEEAGLPWISPRLRIKWLKAYFKGNKKIKIKYMCEDGLLSFPNGLDEWSQRFKKITKHKVNVKFADETYRELNEKYFPECEFVCFDRKKINISATMIRNDPKKYFDYIIEPAKPFFAKLGFLQNSDKKCKK